MLPVYSKILYATDLSPAARKALGHAAALADGFNADVTVLHVLPDNLELFSEEAGIDLADAFGEEAARWIGKGEGERATAAIHERLHDMVNEDFIHPQTGAHLEGADIKVACGDPGERILKEAREGAYDLIVMGAHGRGALMDMVLGSTARETIKKSPVPVFVVPLPADGREGA